MPAFPSVASPGSHLQPQHAAITPALESLHPRLWRGSSLGVAADPCLPSGFAALDAQLPGGGWPLRAVTELLSAQEGVLEWRLLAPALRHWWAGQHPRPMARTPHAAPGERRLLLVNPPHTPHLPGLQALGLPSSALIWVSAGTPAQQLWATEQAIKSCVAVLAWLPEARPEQIRRLQVKALNSDAPAFLLRPEHASQQSSAAPLRVIARQGEGWDLAIHLLKRRGPAHEGWLSLPALPSAIAPLLTAGKRQSQSVPSEPDQRSSDIHVHAPVDTLARPALYA